MRHAKKFGPNFYKTKIPRQQCCVQTVLELQVLCSLLQNEQINVNLSHKMYSLH